MSTSLLEAFERQARGCRLLGAAFTAGLAFAPRLTRLIAATFTALGVSDALQMAYRAGKQS